MPTALFAEGYPAVLGLLHMLQALKHDAPRYRGAFAAKFAPIQPTVLSNLLVTLSNLSAAQGFCALLVMIVIAWGEMNDAVKIRAVNEQLSTRSRPARSGPQLNRGSTPRPCSRSD